MPNTSEQQQVEDILDSLNKLVVSGTLEERTTQLTEYVNLIDSMWEIDEGFDGDFNLVIEFKNRETIITLTTETGYSTYEVKEKHIIVEDYLINHSVNHELEILNLVSVTFIS